MRNILGQGQCESTCMIERNDLSTTVLQNIIIVFHGSKLPLMQLQKPANFLGYVTGKFILVTKLCKVTLQIQ